MKTSILTVLFVGVLSSFSAVAAEVQVAVAANFAAPMQKIATAFEQTSGHKAKISVGATGKFQTQIQNGAPFEVLLAADVDTPTQLAQSGYAVASTQFVYATGKLVLWSPVANRIDPAGQVLRETGWNRLALADPKLAPYGAAAMETLTQLGLAAQLKERLVFGDSIGQAYQFVASGNADLGFIALSQVMENGQLRAGSVWQVPANFYRPIRQAAILLKTGESNPAAQALLTFLRSPPAQDLIRAYGYDI